MLWQSFTDRYARGPQDPFVINNLIMKNENGLIWEISLDWQPTLVCRRDPCVSFRLLVNLFVGMGLPVRKLT